MIKFMTEDQPKPTKRKTETLAELNAYKPEDFKTFLDFRLRQQHGSDPEARYRALDFRGLGVRRDDTSYESYLDDIKNLFGILSPQARQAFQDGLRDLILTADPNNFPLEAMRDIILLVATLGVTQALETFIPTIANGAWGKKYPSLIYDCAGVMLSFERNNEAEELEKILRNKISRED